jgi:TonB family protein
MELQLRSSFTVDVQGRVQHVKIVSGDPDRWADKTAAEILSQTRFPPIPENVLRKLDMDHQAVSVRRHFKFGSASGHERPTMLLTLQSAQTPRSEKPSIACSRS